MKQVLVENKVKHGWLFLLVIGFMMVSFSAEARVVVKLGTVAPKGSPWYNALKLMGDEWKQASGGQVILKIYPGGILGNEIDMVRKMRQGRLQAGTISSIGVREIDSAYLGLQIPRIVQNEQEMDAAMEAVIGLVSKRLEEKGFILLQHGDTGWIRLFVNKDVKSLADLQKLKYFVGAADAKSKEAWVRGGFKPVQVNAADILPSLQTGLIDGFVGTPLAALAMQWFGLAKYMVDFNVAPLVGATLITKKTWDKIPADIQVKLKEIALRYAKKDLKRIRELDEEAIATMEKHGLKRVVFTKENREELDQAFHNQWQYIRDEVIPGDVFDTIQKAAETVRAKAAESAKTMSVEPPTEAPVQTPVTPK